MFRPFALPVDESDVVVVATAPAPLYDVTAGLDESEAVSQSRRRRLGLFRTVGDVVGASGRPGRVKRRRRTEAYGHRLELSFLYNGESV